MSGTVSSWSLHIPIVWELSVTKPRKSKSDGIFEVTKTNLKPLTWGLHQLGEADWMMSSAALSQATMMNGACDLTV